MVVWRQPLPSSLLRRPETHFPFTIPLALVPLSCTLLWPLAVGSSFIHVFPCLAILPPSCEIWTHQEQPSHSALLPDLGFCFLLPMLLTFQAKLEKSNSLWERNWVQSDSILSPWSWIWDFWYCPLTWECKNKQTKLESWEKLNLPSGRKGCQGRTYNSSVKQKATIHLTSKSLPKMTASPFRVDTVEVGE